MDDTASERLDVTAVDVQHEHHIDAPLCKVIFPFLRLPRELRDTVRPRFYHYEHPGANLIQIYDYTFQIEDERDAHALRIERRHLKHFRASAAAVLLVTHHEYLLLNRQVAREALEVLFKKHTVFLCCGPFVLKALLEKIEKQNGPGRQWLKWLQHIELDWVSFPSLTHYPPEWGDSGDWYYEPIDHTEVDIDSIRGAQYSGHYDEHDHDGAHYDDNFYDPSDATLYPSFQLPPAQPPNPNDPFGFANHYPFTNPSHSPPTDDAPDSQAEISTKLQLLIKMEVTPLFTYLTSPTFNLSSISLPLYFISRESYHLRNATRPGYALPLKVRYWVNVCVYALLMLLPSESSSTLREVRVRYLPTDIWASMDPADDLNRVVEKGVWFDEEDEDEAVQREGEGQAFREVWDILQGMGYKGRMGLSARVKYVKWDGNMDAKRVGDELEVVFTRAEN
jgi:hypothetical protein